MRGKVVSKENALVVKGRLKKFFGHGSFVVWHQWDGGMRKRLGRYVTLFTGCSVCVERRYSGVEVVEHSEFPDVVLGVRLSHDDGLVIKLGDEVWFLGNRVILKTKSPLSNHDYLYECFQIDK